MVSWGLGGGGCFYVGWVFVVKVLCVFFVGRRESYVIFYSLFIGVISIGLRGGLGVWGGLRFVGIKFFCFLVVF